MHAGFPCLLPELQQTLKLGAHTATKTGELPAFLNEAAGRLLANGMAVLLRLGFGFLLRDSLLGPQVRQMALFYE